MPTSCEEFDGFPVAKTLKKAARNAAALAVIITVVGVPDEPPCEVTPNAATLTGPIDGFGSDTFGTSIIAAASGSHASYSPSCNICPLSLRIPANT